VLDAGEAGLIVEYPVPGLFGSREGVETTRTGLRATDVVAAGGGDGAGKEGDAGDDGGRSDEDEESAAHHASAPV
jgi:hypothetical protein